MALGLQTESGGGGDFTPILNYDARAGRMFRVDRTQDSSGSWQTDNVEVTQGFQAVFDLEQVQVGWCLFAAGVAPSFDLVPLGSPLPARPSDQHKQGFKMLVKLGKSSGGDVRELSATSKAVLGAIDELHTTYEAEKIQHPGQLPVVSMPSTKAVVSTGQGKSSTNYAPVFEIVKWVDRPAELPLAANNNAPQAAQATQPVPQMRATSQAVPDNEEEF
jgi:hypothetical protein